MSQSTATNTYFSRIGSQALVYIGFVLLSLVLPLAYAPGIIFPGTAGRAFIFLLICDSIFLPAAIVHWEYFRIAKLDVFDKCIIALFITGGVAAVAGVNVWVSLWSTADRMTGLWFYLHAIIAFFVGRHVLTKQMKQRTMDYFIYASALAAVIGFFQGMGGAARATGPYLNPLIFGSALIVPYIFACGRAVLDRKYISIWSLSAALIGLGVISTAVRGVIIAMVVGTVLLFVYAYMHSGQLNKKSLKVMLGLLVSGVMVMMAVVYMQREALSQSSYVVFRTFGSLLISPFESTAGSRLTTWQIAMQGIKERPLFGFGPENFNYVFNTHYDSTIPTDDYWFDRAHNILLDGLVDVGFVGVIVAGGVLIAFVYVLRRGIKNNDISNSLGAIMIVALIASGVQLFFAFNTILTIYGILVVLLFLPQGAVEEKNVRASSYVRMLGFGFGIIVALGVIIPPFVMFARTHYVLRNIEAGDLSKAIEASSFLNAAKGMYVLDARRAVIDGVSLYVKQNQSVEGLDQLLGQSTTLVGKNITKDSRNPLWYAFRGELLLERARDGELSQEQQYARDAINDYNTTLSLSPNRAHVYASLATAYRLIGDDVRTWAMIDRAKAFAPKFHYVYESMFTNALALKDLKRAHEAEDWFRINRGVDNDITRRYYLQYGYPLEAARVERDVINEKKDSYSASELANRYVNLAVMLKMTKQYNEALQLIPIILELDPSLKTKATGFEAEVKKLRGY